MARSVEASFTNGRLRLPRPCSWWLTPLTPLDDVPVGAIKGEAYTVYTNLATAGAMRAYGIPQISFALESHIDDIAKVTGLDPIALQKKYDEVGVCRSHHHHHLPPTGLEECIERGEKYLNYSEKRENIPNRVVLLGAGGDVYLLPSRVYSHKPRNECLPFSFEPRWLSSIADGSHRDRAGGRYRLYNDGS